ncbi:MAG TPA: MgtC/SapB family protein [Chloroflexota bacterium]|nr:MgtC/SapB family protein [Chloroflexota bacterium]
MALLAGPEVTLTLQIALAGVLASIIGWQRHHVGRPAGVRTHALVAMAAAMFTLAGIYGFGGPTGTRDPTRVAAQIVSGIGFIGAGTIFRSENTVYGLTTAATLWFAAAQGVLVGAGLEVVAALASGLALVVLVVAGAIERRGERHEPVDAPHG